MKGDRTARKELGVMMDAIKRETSSIFTLGKFRARKKLANGAVVTLVVTMPPVQQKSVQEQAFADIRSGAVSHDKRNCPGCPIH